MGTSQLKIAEWLLKTESVQVYRDRPFVFASGRVSPVYVDCRKLLSFPNARDEIVQQLVMTARNDIGLDILDVIAGGETAGIPYAAFVAHVLKKPMIYVRKAPKGYGRAKQIEGVLEPNQRVLLVEDLITDGKSKLHFNEGIRAAGALITHCLCVFEYGLDRLGPSEGRRLLAEHDIKLHSLVTWDDVLSTGRDKSYFTDQVSRQIQDFLVEPEGWGRKMGFE